METNSIKASEKHSSHQNKKKGKREAEYSEKLNWIFNCRISEDFTISNVNYELLKGSDSQPCFTFIHATPQRASLAGQTHHGKFFLDREAHCFRA